MKRQLLVVMAGVALLCAALLNSGRTTLRKVARIEEVNRILEVLTSIGVRTRWLNDDNDLIRGAGEHQPAQSEKNAYCSVAVGTRTAARQLPGPTSSRHIRHGLWGESLAR